MIGQLLARSPFGDDPPDDEPADDIHSWYVLEGFGCFEVRPPVAGGGRAVRFVFASEWDAHEAARYLNERFPGYRHSDPPPTVPTLAALVAECHAAARDNGYADGYELTHLDGEYIVDTFAQTFGRKPTLAEWTEAGLPFVGSAHYEEDEDA